MSVCICVWVVRGLLLLAVGRCVCMELVLLPSSTTWPIETNTKLKRIQVITQLHWSKSRFFFVFVVFFSSLVYLYLSHSHETLFQWMAHSVLCEFLTKKHITTNSLRCFISFFDAVCCCSYWILVLSLWIRYCFLFSSLFFAALAIVEVFAQSKKSSVRK